MAVPGGSQEQSGDPLSVVESFRTTFDGGRVQLAPGIDGKKLARALGAYGDGIEAADVLVLVDTTLFGGAKNGALLTATTLHTHDAFSEPDRLRYDEIDDLELDGNKLTNRDRRLLDVGVIDDKDALLEMIRILATSDPAPPTGRRPEPGETDVETVSLEGQIVPCGVCSNIRPAVRSHTIHTAIERTSTAHVAFKTNQTTVQTCLFRRLEFGVCETCCQRHRRRNWLLCGVAAVIIAFCVVQWLLLTNLTGWQFLWPLAITILGAGFVSGRFADTDEAVKRRAVKDRTPGAQNEVAFLLPLQPGYPGAHVETSVVGYTEYEFKRVRKQLQ